MYYLPIYRVQIGDLGSRLASLSVTSPAHRLYATRRPSSHGKSEIYTV